MSLKSSINALRKSGLHAYQYQTCYDALRAYAYYSGETIFSRDTSNFFATQFKKQIEFYRQTNYPVYLKAFQSWSQGQAYKFRNFGQSDRSILSR